MKKLTLLFIGLLAFYSSSAQNSLLSVGDWHSMVVSQEGLYKIDKAMLNKMGIDISTLNPKTIKIYSNHGGVLSEKINTPANQDLTENAIFVQGESDSKFDNNDYIVFYAQPADVWKPNGNSFVYEKNIYTSGNQYYLTHGGNIGKRINTEAANMGLIEETTINKHDILVHHENDKNNIMKSGKLWVGELFDFDKTQEFSENINGIIPNSDITFISRTFATSNLSSTFNLFINNTLLGNAVHTGVSGNLHASEILTTKKFKANGGNVKLKFRYSKPNSIAKGWLDYYELRGKGNLGGNAQVYRIEQTSQHANVKYQFAGNAHSIINVSNPNNIYFQSTKNEGGNTVFKQNTNNQVQTFIAFNYNTLPNPTYTYKVKNLNLRNLSPAEYLIITHAKFEGAADEMKKIYDARGIKTHVINIEDIYTAFNYGSQDISAIRNFLRQNYYKNLNTAHPLKYVLLMGDASYDYKDRVKNNSNYIPVFESKESLNDHNSYCTDDFYGYLKDGEGDLQNNISQKLLISLGRFTVNTSKQAFEMVEKVKRYYDKKSLGPWRTQLTFSADDTDKDWDSIHLFDTDDIAEYIDTTEGIFLNSKIYEDAYLQENLSGGERYPEASADVDRRIDAGNLFFTYTGHGSEERLSSESLIDKDMINAWNNTYKMPVFFTATCEFTRFDDAGHTSGGESVFLNPDGGAIAMMTTTRVVYVHSNKALQNGVWRQNLLKRTNNGKLRTLGDAFIDGKNSFVDDNNRRFALIGDPALKLAIPEHYIVTDSINGQDYSVFTDTLKALSKVTIKGRIQDYFEKLQSDFNGKLTVTFFDKKNTLNTRQNGQFPPIPNYKLWNSIIYKGTVTVVKGKFSFSFVIPKDISYKVGTGKLMYYAENGITDAAGFAADLKIGSSSGAVSQDNNKGPKLKLFMDDYTFVSGGLTGKDPLFIADITDIDGLNTTGSGIGREMVVILDKDSENAQEFFVNNFYQAKLNSFQTGEVRFPLTDISPGVHRIDIKVWDVFNNSTSAFINFKVGEDGEIKIENLHNIPNPFSVKTKIIFDHNLANKKLTINLNITNMYGQSVFNRQYVQDNALSRVSLDVSPSKGYFKNGVYIARLILTNEHGESTKSSIKIVVVR